MLVPSVQVPFPLIFPSENVPLYVTRPILSTPAPSAAPALYSLSNVADEAPVRVNTPRPTAPLKSNIPKNVTGLGWVVMRRLPLPSLLPSRYCPSNELSPHDVFPLAKKMKTRIQILGINNAVKHQQTLPPPTKIPPPLSHVH